MQKSVILAINQFFSKQNPYFTFKMTQNQIFITNHFQTLQEQSVKVTVIDFAFLLSNSNLNLVKETLTNCNLYDLSKVD